MAIQQRLQQHHHIGLGHPRRSLQHQRLVELLHRATRIVHPGQPAHDRGDHHRPDPLITVVNPAGQPDHSGQPNHGLLNENIARPKQQARRPSPGHHLHRQDAVATKLEERVVGSDPL
ncbi:hypothetical protein LAUMK13_03008 [Mycobacterium innocens]|uniref:Uncharacterized protein n=1 Tax=Mycobacterium innocens TaxID=2341083 RepID=A0A498Q3H7_9MYCO|nr:hypothetical protein LAUMK13_03008 [Mycobacterium innocens]